MGRPRTFDAQEMLALAAKVFLSHGYDGSSIDDLVQATSVQRGSIYKAFGSKRGLFLACLQLTAHQLEHENRIDLMLIALIELAPHDCEVRTVCIQFLAGLPSNEPTSNVIGRRILARAQINHN